MVMIFAAVIASSLPDAPFCHAALTAPVLTLGAGSSGRRGEPLPARRDSAAVGFRISPGKRAQNPASQQDTMRASTCRLPVDEGKRYGHPAT